MSSDFFRRLFLLAIAVQLELWRIITAHIWEVCMEQRGLEVVLYLCERMLLEGIYRRIGREFLGKRRFMHG